MLNLAFGVPAITAQGVLGGLNAFVSVDQVRELQARGTKVKLAMGGWSYRRLFKPLVDPPHERALFAAAVVEACQQLDLDGIDMDFEIDLKHPSCEPGVHHPTDEALVDWFSQIRKGLDNLPGKKRHFTFTVMSPSSDFDRWIQQSATLDIFDAIQIMAYNPYEMEGENYPPAPFPYDRIADLHRHHEVLGISKKDLILGLMPGWDDHSRCTSAMDVARDSLHILGEGFGGIMTWDYIRDIPSITGFQGSVTELIHDILKEGRTDIAGLPTTCPPWTQK